MISSTLRNAGIKPHLTGFIYLKEEIMILFTEPTKRQRATSLYENIAKKYDISVGSVERDIRYAINDAYYHSHNKMQNFMDIIDDNHIPTNFEFVYWIIEILKINLLSM